jgi:ABC-type transport system involved in cytochrome c biogenesis permease component
MSTLQQANWRAIWGIMRKDLRVAFSSKSVVVPMILLPLILVVLLPLAMALSLNFFGAAVAASGDFNDVMAMIPDSLKAQMADNSPLQTGALFILRNLFAPIYLILPIMTSSVIAADAFAGEKERKTLEALLYTPTSDRDLMLAKVLGALIPGLLVAWISAVAYWFVVDIAAWPLFGRPILPNVTWLILAFWVAPAAAAMSLGATVVVSSRSKSIQDANQISGLVVLPVVVIMMGQAFGVMFLSPTLALLIGLVFYVVAAVLFWIGARSLRRSELLSRI